MSDALLTIPHESTKAEHGIVVIVTLETLEQGFHLCIFNHCDDGTVHGWPCMGAEMRITTFSATSTCLFEDGVSTHVGIIQGFNYIHLMSLVVCYKYCLHNLIANYSFIFPPQDGICS